MGTPPPSGHVRIQGELQHGEPEAGADRGGERRPPPLPPSGGSPQGEHLHRAVLGRDLNAAGEHHCVLPHQEAYCALLRGGEYSPQHRPPGGEQQEPRFLPPPTPLPTAPCALTQQPLNASTQFDLESAMAQLQAQNSALLNHLAIQQQQTEGPRPSQYPMV